MSHVVGCLGAALLLVSATIASTNEGIGGSITRDGKREKGKERREAERKWDRDRERKTETEKEREESERERHGETSAACSIERGNASIVANRTRR